MRAFLASVVAAVIIAVIAAVILSGSDSSVANVFSSGNVRL